MNRIGRLAIALRLIVALLIIWQVFGAALGFLELGIRGA
jgi:hypothetical protein